MTHRQAIAALLQAIVNRERPTALSSAVRGEAEAHVARCSDCWNVLALLGAADGGEAPTDLERMRQLYGCDAVRDDLWLLDGLAPDVVRDRFPHVVSHLWWCEACRDRYLEIVSVAAAAAAGEIGQPVFASVPVWRDVVGAAGRAVRELVGSAVIAIEGRVASFTRVPEGVALVPLTVARGTGPARGPAPQLVQRIRVALGDSPLAVEISVAMRKARLVDATILVSGPGADRLSIELGPTATPTHLTGPERHATRVGQLVTFRDLGDGDYVVDIQPETGSTIQRIAFSVRLVS